MELPWLMATMATMATLVADLLKKNLHLENSVGWLSPRLTTFCIFFFSIFNLRVAMVAMVAVT